MCVDFFEMELLKCLLYEFFQRNNIIRKLNIENIDDSGMKNAFLLFGLKYSSYFQSLWIVNFFRSSCLSNLMYFVNFLELVLIFY